jgi:hypothetical protein
LRWLVVQRSGDAGDGKLKMLSRALVGALIVVVALAGFNVTIPAGRSAASNWKVVVTHATILGHVIVATMILVGAVIALIMSVRGRDRSWIVVSAAGLVFVVLAFAGGLDYVTSLSNGALDYMSFGWAAAVIVYGTGWYLGRRRERPAAKVKARELTGASDGEQA